MPSMTGISRSRITTSTDVRFNSARAASPFAARATTVIGACRSSIWTISPRAIAESSTTITRISELTSADVDWQSGSASMGREDRTLVKIGSTGIEKQLLVAIVFGRNAAVWKARDVPADR